MKSGEMLRDHKGQTTDELRAINIIMNSIIRKSQIKCYSTQFKRVKKKGYPKQKDMKCGEHGVHYNDNKEKLKIYFEQLPMAFCV